MNKRQRVALVLAGLLAACETPPAAPSVYPVLVRALTEDGEPLAGVEIIASDQRAGRTGEEGTLLLELKGQEGTDVMLSPRCPAGSKPFGEVPSLRLRTLPGGARPEVEVMCGRDKRTAALLVTVPGFGGLPILVHDREVGRTDATGTAHVVLQGDPSTPLRVVLDTSSMPKVIPPSPHRDLQVGTRDEIIVFDPQLTEVKDPPRRHRHKKVEKPPPVIIPERLR